MPVALTALTKNKRRLCRVTGVFIFDKIIKINLNKEVMSEQESKESGRAGHTSICSETGKSWNVWGTASWPAWMEQGDVNTCRKRGLGYPGAGPHRAIEAVIRALGFISSKMETSEGSGQRNEMTSSISGYTTPQHPSSFPTTLCKPSLTTTDVPDPHYIL